MPPEQPPPTFIFPKELEAVGSAVVWQAAHKALFGGSSRKIVYQGPHRRKVSLPTSEHFLAHTRIHILEKRNDGDFVEVTVTLPMDPLFPGSPPDEYTESFRCELSILSETSVAINTVHGVRSPPSSDGIDLAQYQETWRRRDMLGALLVGGGLLMGIFFKEVRETLEKLLGKENRFMERK